MYIHYRKKPLNISITLQNSSFFFSGGKVKNIFFLAVMKYTVYYY